MLKRLFPVLILLLAARADAAPYSNSGPYSTQGQTISSISSGAITVNSSGYIGIGTSNPASALDIAGVISLNGANGLGEPTQDSTPYCSLAVGNGALTNMSGSSAAYCNLAVGYHALNGSITTAGIQNTAIGAFAGTVQTTGDNNTWVGFDAGFTDSTGNHNTGIGSFALQTNSTGTDNTAVGYQALKVNSIGASNSALGSGALAANTTGGGNTAIGVNALHANITNNNNTAVGQGSLATSISSSNTGVGFNALTNATTGGNNTGLGLDAGLNVSSGGNSTFIGFNAGGGNGNTLTGNNNEGVGYFSLENCTGTCNQNVAIGSRSQDQTTSGSNDTSLGFSSLRNMTTGTDNTAIGMQAMLGDAANKLTGQFNTALGSNALSGIITTGANNTAVGYQSLKAGTALTTGTGNTAVGYQAQVNSATASNRTAIGNGAASLTDNDITLGNASIATIHAEVTSITAISDRRHKKDIEDSDLGLDFLMKLRPVHFTKRNGDEHLRYGVIAQELEEALPANLKDMVETSPSSRGLALLEKGTDADHTYSVAYGELTAPTIKAIQELNVKVDGINGVLHAHKCFFGLLLCPE